MTNKGYPPISPGTLVKTTEDTGCDDWTREALASRKWGVRGMVITHHDSHGLCYEVKHEDGTVGYYDPSEIEVVKSINLDELQEEMEKLLSLLKDRQPGLFTWNEFLMERMKKIHSLLSCVV